MGTAILLVLAAACSRAGGDSGGAGNVVPTAATTTTIDPFAVPAAIDASYVNKVLAGLDAANGDILRLYFRDRRITTEIDQRIRALYVPERYDTKVRTLELDRDTNVAGEVGNQVTTVSRLIAATPACIYVQVDRDYRPVAGRPGIPVQWVGLRSAPVLAGTPLAYNPTHWMYTVDGVMPDRSQPPNPCTGS